MRRLTFLFIMTAIAASLGVARAADYTKITDVRVAMDDGVVLSADVYVPTVPDGDGDGLYPCVVELTPYRKETRYAEGASYLPAQGIALIEVDARGTGGSAGEYDIVFSTREQRDMAEWIDFAATKLPKAPGGTEPLCEERVGTYGGSYSGIIQYLTASLPLRAGDEGYGRLPLGSEHLAAIAPQRAYGDLYRDIVYHGGMVIGSFGNIWSAGTTAYYTEPPTDVNTEAGARAWTDHLTKNDPLIRAYLERPYADDKFTSNGSPGEQYTQKIYDDSSVLPRIGNLRVPTLHLAGFYDAFTRGQLRTFSEAHAREKMAAPGARGPNFLIAGPWNHSGTHFISPDQGFKQNLADWYHYWLEDRANGSAPAAWIANGFDGTGARARYFQTTSGKINSQTVADGTWRNAPTWPLSKATVGTWHLGSNGSLNRCDGPPPCVSPTWSATYVSNPASGNGEILSRWDNAAGTPQPQWDQRLEGGRGLTFQTPALTADLSVAGPIGFSLRAAVIGLHAGGSVNDDTDRYTNLTPPYLDTDFVVKISDVAPDGTALLVTQGYLRASHRAYDPDQSVWIDGRLMAPFHEHTHATLAPPRNAQATDYEIEVWPVAKTFAAGHRLRLDIHSADTPNHLTILSPTYNTVSGGALRLPVVFS